MNKSIFKHEIRSIKWIILLSIIASFLIIFAFSMNLDNAYSLLFDDGMPVNRVVVQEALRYITDMIMASFIAVSVIQVFLQFRPEKNQETGRFLRSLPIKRNEFVKIKLAVGIGNLTIAFLVIILGIGIARSSNMFWIKDIYNVSVIAEPYAKVDSMLNLLKEIGMIYMVIVSLYSFLFMVQYTFSNVVGGVVAGILAWLAPAFIALATEYSIGKLFSLPNIYGRNINILGEWLFPWLYPLSYDYNYLFVEYGGIHLRGISIISYMGLKYLILSVIILLSIIMAYKLNKGYKIENENMIIPFRPIRIIFIIGFTICSGLFLGVVLNNILNHHVNTVIYGLLLIIGSIIGYFISRKIARVGVR